MIIGRLKDVLDNIGPGVHDVCLFDLNGLKLSEDDLKQHDFDNIGVIDKQIDEESIKTGWIIMNIVLSLKKAAD